MQTLAAAAYMVELEEWKRERKSLPKSQEQTVTSEAGTLGGVFQIAAARTYFNIRRKWAEPPSSEHYGSVMLADIQQPGKGSLRKTQLILGQGDWLLAGSGLQAAKVRGPLVSSASRTSWIHPVCGSNSDSQTHAQDSTCGSRDLCLLRIRERLNSRKICGLSIKPEKCTESQAYSKPKSSISKTPRTTLPQH